MTPIEMGLWGGGAAMQLLLLWQVIATRRTVAWLESRLGRQADALALLTETAESGFAAVARELERSAAAGVKPARRPTVQRLATAIDKGQTISEVAAGEEISEGEVRLRLWLASQATKAKSSRGRRSRAGLPLQAEANADALQGAR
jgi:hypothetical protein